MRYAMIVGQKVVNVVLWDGDEDWKPGPQFDVIDCPAHVGPGWGYVDGAWVEPPPLPPVTDAD